MVCKHRGSREITWFRALFRGVVVFIFSFFFVSSFRRIGRNKS